MRLAYQKLSDTLNPSIISISIPLSRALSQHDQN